MKTNDYENNAIFFIIFNDLYATNYIFSSRKN